MPERFLILQTGFTLVENDIEMGKNNNSLTFRGLNASETYNLEVYWKITSNLGDRFDNNTGKFQINFHSRYKPKRRRC